MYGKALQLLHWTSRLAAALQPGCLLWDCGHSGHSGHCETTKLQTGLTLCIKVDVGLAVQDLKDAPSGGPALQQTRKAAGHPAQYAPKPTQAGTATACANPREPCLVAWKIRFSVRLSVKIGPSPARRIPA